MQTNLYEQLVPWVYSLYPNITDGTIRKNLIELTELKRQEPLCKGCFGREHCPVGTGGVKLKLILLPDGIMATEHVHCEHNQLTGGGKKPYRSSRYGKRNRRWD